jgi:hypothetical protein
MWHWRKLARRNAHSVAVSLKFAIKVLPKRSKSLTVLIRLVDSATLACVARHARDDVGKLLHHRACQHVRHALELVAYLAPDLHSWDPTRLGNPLVVGVVNCDVVNCASKSLRDLIVLQDAEMIHRKG